MFDISLRWQDGAIQIVIYSAIVCGLLFIASKIELDDGGETPIKHKKGKE